jgi:hypothetical protein
VPIDKLLTNITHLVTGAPTVSSPDALFCACAAQAPRPAAERPDRGASLYTWLAHG